MAEDHVLDWLTALRERPHRGVPDIALVDVARHLGAVDGEGSPLHEHYAVPGELTAKQLDSVISRIQSEYARNSVPVGESVGAITGQSCGEAATQLTLRTFHYAGVAKSVPPADIFSKMMGIRQTPYHIAIALAPEYAFSREKAVELVKGLQKDRLRDVITIDLGSQRYFEIRSDFSDESRWIQDGDYGEMFEVASALMESGQMVVSSAFYSPDDLSHLLHSVLTRYDDPAGFPGLRSRIQFGREEIDGEERLMISAPHLGSRLVRNLMDVLNDVEMCGHCGSSFHYLKFQEIGKRKRRDPVADQIESVSAEDYAQVHDRESAMRELETTGYIGNPLDEDAVFGSPDWVLGVRMGWTEDPARYRWSLAKRDQSNRCKECGLGWTVDNVQLHQWGAASLDDDYWGADEIESVESRELEISAGFGLIQKKGEWHSEDVFCRPEICDDEPCQREFIYTRKRFEPPPPTSVYGNREGRTITADWDLKRGVWLGPREEEGSRVSSKWALNKADAVEDQMSYPGDGRLGAGTDYPVAYLHDGAIINDGREGEWYIVVRGRIQESKTEKLPSLLACGALTKPPARFKGVDMATLPTKGKGSFAGYFALLDGDERFDFMRSTCDCPVQVFHALGIEACRSVWLHNLYGTFSRSPEMLEPNKLVPSDSIPVHIKHYMMLVDACCSGTIPMHIRGGDASVSGNASQKGSRSFARNGVVENYADALSIASYERPLSVLYGLAPMGVTDVLGSFKSQQIVGQEGQSRRMSPWYSYYAQQDEYDRLIEVLSEMRRVRADIDALSRAELDVGAFQQLYWWEYAQQEQVTIRKDVYDRVMAIPGVSEGFRRLGELEVEWEKLSAVFELERVSP